MSDASPVAEAGGLATSRPRLPALEARVGAREWLRGYLLMILWEALSLRLLLPIMVVVQVFIGGGLIVGLGFLFDEIPSAQAVYLAAGGSVVALMSIGLVGGPQMIAQRRIEGSYNFLFTLPVPRTAAALATITVWIGAALPGLVLALVIAAARFDIDFAISPLVLPAVLLTVLMSAAVGQAFAHAIPSPMAVNLLTQLLIFLILLFSPVNFPAERLPGWLDALHEGLPFEAAANVVRDSLTDGLTQHVSRSYAVLGAWTAAAGLVLSWVLGRRR